MKSWMIVIGGGPAGATAAETLARYKKKVLLIERSNMSPYREKPCGGGLGPVTTKLFPFTKNMGIHTTDTIMMEYTEGKRSTKIRADVPIIMVERERFDLALVKRAARLGAKVMFGKTVKAVYPDTREVELNNGLRIQYSHLIGAGGVRCPAAKAMDCEPKTVPLIVGKANGGDLNKNRIAEIIFFEGFKGYAWLFPKGKYMDVGIGGDAPVKELNERLGRLLEEYHTTIYDKTGWAIPFEPLMPIITPTLVTCGDAAGFANPATGEGIRYAMQSGKEAAELALGKRGPQDYPSFMPSLVKLHSHREKFFAGGLGNAFDEMLKSPTLVKETVGFFFEDKPAPSSAPLTDEQRLKALKAIESNLEG